MFGFGKKHHQPQGFLSFKNKFVLLVLVIGVGYIFRGPIMAHFGIEPAEVKTTEAPQQGPKALPAQVMVTQSATVFLEPGRKPYATVAAGQPVSILDEHDNGQAFISVRHNGMAGYIARRDLKLNN